MNELNAIQNEILKAFEKMSEKSMFTEAVLAKKIREISKIEGKNKAGISFCDLEKVIVYLGEEKNAFYSLHLNSANDLLVKKDTEAKMLSDEARKRRIASEKSMSLLTNADLKGKEESKKKKIKRRTERKSLNVNIDTDSDIDDFYK